MGEAKRKQIRNFSQRMRISDGNLTLLKYTFADNDAPLYAIRNVLLQFELDDQEKEILKSISPEVLAIVRKEIIPELDPSVPFFQEQDLFNLVKFQEPDVNKIDMEIRSRIIMKDYLVQQFDVLLGKNPKIEIVLKDLLPGKDKPMANAIVNLSARNLIVPHVDTQLNVLKILAGQAKETIEQTKERLARDSNR